MIIFSEHELKIIRDTAAERGQGGIAFSFYDFTPILVENQIGCNAKNLGVRISTSVKDETDSRLPFTYERVYDDGKIKTLIGGAISYVLNPK